MKNSIFIMVAIIITGALIFSNTQIASALVTGDLIKIKCTGDNESICRAVYYYGGDGKRYAFPNQKVFYTWYSDFSEVVNISSEEMAAIPLGGNVNYRPGVRLVKITTDPKVYAVDWDCWKGGVLRWIETEELAQEYYGDDWNTQIDDIPDTFFTNYRTGDSISLDTFYYRHQAMEIIKDIDSDKHLNQGAAIGISTRCFYKSETLEDKKIISTSVFDYQFEYPKNLLIRPACAKSDTVAHCEEFYSLDFDQDNAMGEMFSVFLIKSDVVDSGAWFSAVEIIDEKMETVGSIEWNVITTQQEIIVNGFGNPDAETQKIIKKHYYTTTNTYSNYYIMFTSFIDPINTEELLESIIESFELLPNYV